MRKKKVSFKIKVLIPILAIFIVSVLIISFFNYRLLDSSVKTKTNANMEIFTDSILAQIRHLNIILDATKQTLNEKHIAIAKTVVDILDSTSDQLSTEKLLRIAQPLDIIELSIANSNGIITASSVPKYIGFDYKLYEPTKVYMKLTDGTLTVLSEEPRASVVNDDVGDMILGDINHYTGIAWKNGGFIQIGFNAGVIGKLQKEINIYKTIEETKIGQNGFGMVLSNGFITAHPNRYVSDDKMSADKMSDVSSDMSGEDWYKTVSSGDGFAWIIIGGTKYYAGYKNENGNTVVALVPEHDYHQERNRLLLDSVMLLLIMVVIITVVIYLVVGRLLRHVNYLVTGIGKIAEGNLDARIEGSYNNEFDKIKDAVNSMAADIKKYMEGKLDAENKLTQSRIYIILSQIQPHFLYNALAVISRLCDKDPAEAKKATINFSNYLRANMNLLESVEPIPFENELNHTIGFLNLAKAMYGEALNVIYDIQTKNFKLPALTMQPIVENAVKHGIGKKEGGGTITISTKETDSGYLVIITDDGVGFEQGKIAENGQQHIGINNVRLRLSVQCGGTLEIKSEIGTGTGVTISIPKLKKAPL
ncbi:MAG: histidine kinase [Treponema sp.]|jgi:sensor histidine kinase YesM|nr:histidine kinase [Treponema sp.]